MRILLSVFAILITIPAFAKDMQVPVIVENPYSYATSAVQKNGAAFMTITNNGEDDKVIAASSEIADKVELHTHIMDGDMMMMREVDGYDLPHGEKVMLKPMGHHIMFMGLKEPLKAGETFPLTLQLEKQGTLEVNVEIKNPGEMEGM